MVGTQTSLNSLYTGTGARWHSCPRLAPPARPPGRWRPCLPPRSATSSSPLPGAPPGCIFQGLGAQPPSGPIIAAPARPGPSAASTWTVETRDGLGGAGFSLDRSCILFYLGECHWSCYYCHLGCLPFPRAPIPSIQNLPILPSPFSLPSIPSVGINLS